MSLYVHDHRLGHAPNPGFQVQHGHCIQTINDDGLRSNGETLPLGGPAILAMGDSYTYGEEVNDGQTWPAYLQRLTRRPVLNGGVTAYGLDQIALRAELLAKKYRPPVIIVSFIEDDLKRKEMRTLWW